MTGSTAHRGRGRPRSPDVDQRIRSAVRALVREGGASAVTFEGVAARSGVAKTSIYRRVRTRGELVFRAVLHGPALAVPDTGSLHDDVRVVVARFAASIADATGRRGLLTVLTALDDDPRFARMYEREVAVAERACIGAVLDGAVERGELPWAPDEAAVHALVVAPIAMRCALGRAPPTDELVDACTRAAVAGIHALAGPAAGPGPG